MDERSVHAGADPVAFRLRHLRPGRLTGVLEAAAKAAPWKARPSTRARTQIDGVAQGRGIACVAYEGGNGYAAMVAEVEVDLRSGVVQPKRFVIALDCGPVSNPDGLRNQTEGGILQGMSRALVEEVTWDDRRVTSNDWETYNSFYLGFDLPAIDIVLIDRPGVPATGAGETAITVVAAAVGNAIFDATGVRLRRAPFTDERIRAALQSLA